MLNSREIEISSFSWKKFKRFRKQLKYIKIQNF